MHVAAPPNLNFPLLLRDGDRELPLENMLVVAAALNVVYSSEPCDSRDRREGMARTRHWPIVLVHKNGVGHVVEMSILRRRS